MTNTRVDLINTDTGVHDSSRHQLATPPGQRSGSVKLTRLTGGLSDGVDVIRIDNGHMQLDVLPTRGMGIWQAFVGDRRFGWRSPVERPVHPQFVDPMRRGGIGWLDGFNELVCRCGLGWQGAPGADQRVDEDGNVVSEEFLPLHGRVANLPAHHVQLTQEDQRVTLTGVVEEASLFGGHLRLTARLETELGSSRFAIYDTVTNAGGTAAEVQLLYHCNLGAPLLAENATFHIASRQVAPRDTRAAEGLSQWTKFRAPEAGYAEQVYFVEPVADAAGQVLAVLAGPGREQAVGVRFDAETLPWCVLWKNTQAVEDGYVAGIEPASGFPGGRQFERSQGRVIALQPGQSVSFRLSLECATTAAACTQMIEEVETMQMQQTPTTHAEPHPKWSPAS